MDPKMELRQLDAEREGLLKKANDGTISEEEAARAEEVIQRIGELVDLIQKRDATVAALKAAGMGRPSEVPDAESAPAGVKAATAGAAFVQSAAMKAHRSEFPLGVQGVPVSVKAAGLGGFVAKADPAPISSGLAGAVVYERLPGITDLTYPKAPTLLDLITRGTTAAAYVEYRQLVSITPGAAVVAEGGLKPLTTLATAVANSAAHVIADGVKITNQELADDGIVASLINSILVRNLWAKIEDLVLNGTGTNEPRGVLNTTGVLQQAFATDIPTTVRKAITLLSTTSDTAVQAVVLNPADDEKLDLMQDAQKRYYSAGPFGAGPATIWGRPRFVSSRVPEGKALMGDFTSIQLLEREGLTVTAFNQNEDDARHNLTYVRAEVRELLMIREPARLLVASLA